MLLALLQDTAVAVADTIKAVIDTTIVAPQVGGGVKGALSGLLTVLIPVVAAVFGGWAFQKVQNYVQWFEKLDPGMKRVLVTAIVYLLNTLALTVGAKLEWTDLTVTGEQISSLLSSTLAFIFHIGNEQKIAKNGGIL